MPPGSRARLSFLSGAPLEGLPGWREVLTLPVPERMAALSDPAVRRRMAAGAASDEAGVLRALANWPILRVTETFADETRSYAGRSVGEIAAERGQEPFDALLDVVVADGLRTGLQPPARPDTDADRALRTEIFRDPRTVIGGSDAGAHLDMMCGAVYSTSLLKEVREHPDLPLEEAVQMLTDTPARFYGLRQRGRLVEGWWADMVLFDPDTVGYGPEVTRHDLPGGASRLYAGSVGVEHVFVNGSAVVTDGRLTGGTPGRLLRSGRDTETVPVAG
jgi:N-acyl-D-aspartate/D-glutamate deacylase